MWQRVKVGPYRHAREFPFGMELDAMLVSRSPLFHKALAASDLDVIIFAEGTELIQVVKFILCL